MVRNTTLIVFLVTLFALSMLCHAGLERTCTYTDDSCIASSHERLLLQTHQLRQEGSLYLAESTAEYDTEELYKEERKEFEAEHMDDQDESCFDDEESKHSEGAVLLQRQHLECDEEGEDEQTDGPGPWTRPLEFWGLASRRRRSCSCARRRRRQTDTARRRRRVPAAQPSPVSTPPPSTPPPTLRPEPAPSPPTPGYIPGEPGAPWSEREVRIVKAKILRLFSLHQNFAVMRELSESYPTDWRDVPGPAKLLRLGFHDCLKYKDGSGGCDGCLNWDGIGSRINESEMYNWSLPIVRETSNNGLRPTVEFLEGVYTDPRFPTRTPALQHSLQKSNKSRADLWALAALVAVEHAIHLNNLACGSPDDPWITGLNQCVRDSAVQCNVSMQRSLIFKTGRRDCVTSEPRSYMAAKKERHASTQTDGKGTLEFFQRDFGFSGEETVAIMGAHTLGRFHVGISGLRYTFAFKNEQLFNNQYFRNIVGKPDWYIEHGHGECKRRGDAYGNKPGKARWLPHVRFDSVDGGPVQWIQEKLVCPNCRKKENEACCSEGVPAKGFCKPDNDRGPDSILPGADDDTNAGCEQYRFVMGVDEAAMQAEIGLYLDFKVKDAVPYGCPGLESFNMSMWKQYGYRYSWSMRDGKKAEPLCPPNMLREPANARPLHEIFEDFADNQQHWVDAFVPALEKMLANGYKDSDLTPGPDISTDIKCPRVLGNAFHSFWSCYSIRGLSKPFLLVSGLGDPQVLQVNMETRSPEMWATTGMDNQLWRWTADKTQLINVYTESPLGVAGEGLFEFRDDCIHVLNSADNKVLDRSWELSNGSLVTVWPYHGLKNQKWVIQHVG